MDKKDTTLHMVLPLEFTLESLYENSQFSNLDYYFSQSVSQAFTETNPIVLATCALTSKALLKGHVCLDLSLLDSNTRAWNDLFDLSVQKPEINEWARALQASKLISDNIHTPFVFDRDLRFYLSRNYDFQSRLIHVTAQRISHDEVLGTPTIEPSFVQDFIDDLFDSSSPQVLAQKKAVFHAVLNRLTIISGGPGTGKTHVTGLIKKTFFANAAAMKLKLPKLINVAPTGKAASKMENGQTIHSVLRPLKRKPGFFFNKENRLNADMVIIDEASMIDIVLLTRLLEAVPDHAKIIILGDQHQLSSIQAGSVFADICEAGPLSSIVFHLNYNFRSKGKTGIEQLSLAVNTNRSDQIQNILTRDAYPDIAFLNSEDSDFKDKVNETIINGFTPLFESSSLDQAFGKMDAFKVLCAHNSGPLGTLSINHVCENILRSHSNFDISHKILNRVIMIRENDYKKELFNGDCGIVTGNNTQERAVFRDLEQRIKKYRIIDLPGNEPAFAITIHKSQGSEFDTVLILIPERLSFVMTRQLLYTGVTRARKKVIIAGNLGIIKQAAGFSTTRMSGLTRGLEKYFNKNRQAS